MQTLWDRAVSAILAMAAIALVGVLVHREFFQASPPGERSRFEADWGQALSASHLLGDPGAPVAIVEFTDLECPFCRRFHASLLKIRERYPTEVSYSLVHYPLAQHAHSLAAARAAECADRAGKFAEALDEMFSHQDSLSNVSWRWLARALGLADDRRFVSCVADTTTPPSVRAGLAVGSKMGIRGTPTVFVNGWRYAGTPSDTEMVRAIGDMLAGRPPYKGFPRSAMRAPAR